MHRKQGGTRVFIGSGLLNQKYNNNADMMSFQAANAKQSGPPSTILGHISSTGSRKQ